MLTKIIETNSKEIYEIDPTKPGENYAPCPACADLHPKNAKKKCFSWNHQKKTGLCHRCDGTFVLHQPRENEKKEYTQPVFDDKTGLWDSHVKYFHSRMISNEAMVAGGLYSSREFMPQLGKEVPVVCFPFKDDGKVINVKYRGPQKSFKLHKGAKKILYNFDSIKGQKHAVIVEGEIDALSFMTCGIPFVVSVPNGANKNLDYLNDCIDVFDETESIILAVDADPKGVELREELARRFGVERCKIVDFKDCKDANEYLVKYGAPELFKAVQTARDYPVSGIFTAADFEDEIYNLWLNGLQPGEKIGVESVDDHITWDTGRLAIITGIPGHGKSEALDWILCKLNIRHKWKCAYFSPENSPLEWHYAKLAEKLIGANFYAKTQTREQYLQALKYIQKNFFFIAPKDDFTVDTILSRARYLVKKEGIKVLVLDPYNRLEHQHEGKSETQYISAFLDKLTNFAQRNGVLVCLVAHPYKLQKEGGKMQVPTLYSISGSSNFFNKTDYGITIYRVSDSNGLTNQIDMWIQKVKFKHLGKTGKVPLIYNYKNGRFEEETPAGINGWDNSNWLDKMIAEETELPF